MKNFMIQATLESGKTSQQFSLESLMKKIKRFFRRGEEADKMCFATVPVAVMFDKREAP
jgi:hypothetical protein